jgi:hypothetical protein
MTFFIDARHRPFLRSAVSGLPKGTIIFVYGNHKNESDIDVASHSIFSETKFISDRLSSCGNAHKIHPRLLTGSVIYSSNKGSNSVYGKKRKNIRFCLDGVNPVFPDDNIYIIRLLVENMIQHRNTLFDRIVGNDWMAKYISRDLIPEVS